MKGLKNIKLTKSYGISVGSVELLWHREDKHIIGFNAEDLLTRKKAEGLKT